MLWAGDFNTTVVASPFLSLIRTLDLWRISPDVSTTKGRASTTSGKAPIDHVLCNSPLLDLAITCACCEHEAISDHLPLSGKFAVLAADRHTQSWKWPRFMDLSATDTIDIGWDFEGSTYVEWSEAAVTWLASTYSTSRVSKTCIGSGQAHGHRRSTQSQEYKCIRKVRGTIARLEKGFVPHLWDCMCAALIQLGSPLPCSLDDARNSVTSLARDMYDRLQKQALAAWRSRVKAWHAQSKQLYKYLRNEEPAKCTAILLENGRLTMVPTQIEACLESFWGGLETWPNPLALHDAIEAVDDIYSLFIPTFPFRADVSAQAILVQLKRMRRTAAGPDGWNREELRALPQQAWTDLLELLRRSPTALSNSVLSLFKRVPIIKDPSVPPSPDNFRPIDVFSQVLRLITSAQVAALRPWLQKVLHRSQFASDRGAVAAVGQLNTVAESVLHGTREVWAFTADFAKLYNTLSPEVAAKAAEVFGLNLQSTPWLIEPLLVARGCWRLPKDSVSPFRSHQRGLPQGLASSVVLSELIVALFLWRTHNIVSITTICYVDDLTVVAESRQNLEKAYDLLIDFTRHLSISLAATKTKLWGSYPTQLEEIANRRGIQHTHVLCALGLQWPLRFGVSPTYPKELKRHAMCRERLRRLAHLPASIATKAQAVVTGCLSLITYSVVPESKHASGLRISVRHALNQPYGSPEVLFHSLNKSSCDPLYFWILACCRMLCVWLKSYSMPSLATLRSKRALQGRVTAFLRWAKRAGWILRASSLEVPQGGVIHLDRTWGEVRDELKAAYRRGAAHSLTVRRPALYEDLRDWNVKQHRKMLLSLDPHSATLLMRVWMGAAMTAAHAHTVGKSETPFCQCSEVRETVHHIVFQCPLRPPCPPNLLPWAERPAHQSHAFLCPLSCPKDVARTWQLVCKRAISLLSLHATVDAPIDWRGHIVHADSTGEYTYCINCLATRKSCDAKHIAAKPCPGCIWGGELVEGTYFLHHGHVLRMVFRPWKRAARRPALQCMKCAFWNWPSYRIGRECDG